MANILITGANGQLGSELRKIGFSPLDEVFFTDVAELDIIRRSKSLSRYMKWIRLSTVRLIRL